MLPIVAAVVVVVVVVLSIFLMATRKSGDGKKGRSKDKAAILKTATKKLTQNPKDRESLLALGGIYFEENDWEKAFRMYQTLMDMYTPGSTMDVFEISLRYAISAQNLNNLPEAYKGFQLAKTTGKPSFEVSFNLGVLEVKSKNYEKAVPLLKQALTIQPESIEPVKHLGQALYKLGRPKDAMPYMRKVAELYPDDKENLLAIAQCAYDLGQNEQALKVFTHLRADPVMGPQACLLAGTINLKSRQYDKAIQDFEIGMKHTVVPPDVAIELRYRLASAYSMKQEIGKALPLLLDIRLMKPGYKDVDVQIDKYKDLNSNRNLQTYLISSSADFVTLCRKIVMAYIPKSKVKITNISVQGNEHADILTEVETPKWEDVILYRFIRSTGKVGELVLRDFHAHLKESKAGRGYCFSPGEFSDEARRFVEARLIDLIGKGALVKILERLK
ncbi:MAG: tetratricopeptide repeat protein [Spirochaetaceae bacterium]|nr:tetratricopeptide repeat protein [Spirochaetaceae bacterium]